MVAFTFLWFVSGVLTLALLLKTKFWEYPLGVISLWISGGLFATTGYIVTRRLGWIPSYDSQTVLTAIGILFSVPLCYHLYYLFKKNWNFWAWTKEK